MVRDREQVQVTAEELGAAMYDDDAPRDVEFTTWAKQGAGVREYWIMKARRILTLISAPRQ